MALEKHVLRYLSVKALAEQGVGGERTNAKNILKVMEQKFPGIAAQASQYKKTEADPDPPPGVWPTGAPPSPAPEKETGNWENLFFNAAQAAFHGAYGFASTLTNVVFARQLALERVDVYARETRSGNIILSVRMEGEVYDMAVDLNGIQKTAFRDYLLERVRGELDLMLWGPPEG